MVKGYSGVFRLGEATSTLDADSPVRTPVRMISIPNSIWHIINSIQWLTGAGDSAGALGAHKR